MSSLSCHLPHLPIRHNEQGNYSSQLHLDNAAAATIHRWTTRHYLPAKTPVSFAVILEFISILYRKISRLTFLSGCTSLIMAPISFFHSCLFPFPPFCFTCVHLYRLDMNAYSGKSRQQKKKKSWLVHFQENAHHAFSPKTIILWHLYLMATSHSGWNLTPTCFSMHYCFNHLVINP